MCENTIKLLTHAAVEALCDFECGGIPVADGGKGMVDAV